MSRGPAQESVMWPETRMSELTTKATQTKAIAKLQDTGHEQDGRCLSVSATFFRQPHLSLYCTLIEIEEDIHIPVESARQLQGDNACMSSSPSKSRNGRFERERQDGPVLHLRNTAKEHVLVRKTVGDQKRYVSPPRMGGTILGEDCRTARAAV